MEQLLGFKIKKVREIKNISQEFVAGKLGITQSAYSSIESGKTKVDEERLNAIAEIFEVDPEIIKNFNEQVVFNSCSQSGYINTNNINPTDIIVELYEKLLSEKDARIKFLEAQINN